MDPGGPTDFVAFYKIYKNVSFIMDFMQPNIKSKHKTNNSTTHENTLYNNRLDQLTNQIRVDSQKGDLKDKSSK